MKRLSAAACNPMGYQMTPVFDPPGPARPHRRNHRGFTVLEIVVVLVLMSIITAVVLGRSITTTDVEVAGQADKIRNHLRYAQSIAMKRSDTVWGIKFSGSEYWFFSGSNPDNGEVRLPGGEYDGASNRIDLSALGVSVTVTGLTTGAVFFDNIGKPYTDGATNNPLGGIPPNPAAKATITVSAAGTSRTIQITPETGLIE